jgi:exodeoxyribonuclease V alpha subunit
MSETIKARVSRVRFRNDQTGFTVLSARIGVKTIPVKCTSIADITEGMLVTATGVFCKDPKYGDEFVAETIIAEPPTTTQGIIRYLTSGFIKGVGATTARKLAARFGPMLWDVLNDNPDMLFQVEGVRKKQIRKLIASWNLQKENNEAMVFLQKFGVGPSTAMRIIKEYGKDTITTVKENPYILAEDVDGIGFKRADSIALNMGYAPDGEHRLKAGILFDIKDKSSAKGDMFQWEKDLLKDTSKLLSVPSEKIKAQKDALVEDGTVIDNDGAVYLPSRFSHECSVAKDIIRLSKAACKEISVPDDLGKDKGINYDDVQLDAIRVAMKSKVMVLTGGPGTGKTTTTNGIIDAWSRAGLKILLAAPTGRAAKRMKEATGRDAKTIHRTLGWGGVTDTGESVLDHNRDMPFDEDALIVDEASMIDTELMSYLLAAVPNKMRLVLVGDVDQLPSVGPGNVLRDIIDSGVVPVVRLTRIFRQAMDSKIITNAHKVNEGKMPEIANNRQSDFFVLSENDPIMVESLVADLVARRLPAGYKVSPSDIQVLTPMRRSNNGVSNLNADLQARLNPQGKEIIFGDTIYRAGDRVIQTRNDYDKNVFNGDTGYIVSVDTESMTLLVDFGLEEPVEYGRGDLINLQLSYATTIHKSQGSEYPIVVIPLTTQFAIMLQRNLIYTAITRAKKVCIIVGQKKALVMAVRNKTIQKRNTLLKERLISEDKKL